MILAVDAYYRDNYAFAAGVLFNDWGDCEPVDKLLAQISNIEVYIPGEFYRRELPCILALLDQLNELPGYLPTLLVAQCYKILREPGRIYVKWQSRFRECNYGLINTPDR